jgi:hypothetical protein
MEKSQPLNSDFNATPPSYTESTNQATPLNISSKGQAPESLPLHIQLAESRSHRINLIISTYIEPLLLTQGASGIFKTTFLLVPSNVTSLQHPNNTPEPDDVIEGTGTAHNNGSNTNHHDEVVGFPASEYIKLVRLHGAEYTSEFWRQPSVLSEFESSLKARLANSGHTISQPPSLTAPIEPALAPAPTPPAASKKSFWSRKKDNYAPTPASAVEEDVTTNSKLGWRAHGEGVEGPAMGETMVTVGPRDVCLRVVTEMGLYETRNGQAVGVTVEVGA